MPGVCGPGCLRRPVAARSASRPRALSEAILAAADRQAGAHFRACAVGWSWPLGPADTAVAFTCLARLGALYVGEGYTVRSAAQPAGLVSLRLARVDRGVAFSEGQLSGPRTGAAAGDYLIVAGAVNRAQIQAMTIVFSDGNLGMTASGQAPGGAPRIYAFAHTGAASTVRTLTAYGATGRAIFTAPPYPPTAH